MRAQKAARSDRRTPRLSRTKQVAESTSEEKYSKACFKIVPLSGNRVCDTKPRNVTEKFRVLLTYTLAQERNGVLCNKDSAFVLLQRTYRLSSGRLRLFLRQPVCRTETFLSGILENAPRVSV